MFRGNCAVKDIVDIVVAQTLLFAGEVAIWLIGHIFFNFLSAQQYCKVYVH